MFSTNCPQKIVRAASRNAREAFCSPSAAIIYLNPRFTLSLCLSGHRSLHFTRKTNIFNFNSFYFNTPMFCCFVKNFLKK
uniref:Candidate secreted effector n=1 Tax=Meloidogyne incognita TaxID=6306 RepID=A0A914MER0_MELIC